MFLCIPGEEKSESYEEILSPEEETGQTRLSSDEHDWYVDKETVKTLSTNVYTWL